MTAGLCLEDLAAGRSRASGTLPAFAAGLHPRSTTLNQRGEPVQVLVMNLLVQRRGAAAP